MNQLKSKRILSGVQPSGLPHLGNYFGAMKSHIEIQNSDAETFIFIADLHALTTIKNPEKLRELILNLAIDYLAIGLEPDKTVFFRQSDIHEHSELTWILNCVTPVSMLEQAHAYKDAVAKGSKDATAGLFGYPVLMAVDILIYKPDLVPVGRDQKQHVEIARDIAGKFNRIYGEVFKLPEPLIHKEFGYVIGTDGKNKMSKSYGNVINMFSDEKTLRKQVMGIVTDSTPLEEPKDPENDTVFKLYSLFADESEKKTLAEKYRAGGFGYGDAKKLLFEKILDTFKPYREKREQLKKDVQYVLNVLKQGAEKARTVASATKQEVWEKIGLML
ncbi:MAG: tryptophan--tRNA ligase [Ignavibacteria bacterium]|nr:tryptophan--tRNA ligase [Ignavibacteria bacterium]